MKQPGQPLACGLMAELVLGVMLFVWSTDMPGDETAPLGRPLSAGVVTGAMVALAVGMVFLLLESRLPETLLMAGAAVSAVLVGGVAAIGFALLVTEPGLGLLLLSGCALAVPVIMRATRLRSGRN